MARTIACPGCGIELPSHLVICPECASPLPKTAHDEGQTEPPRRQRPYAEPPNGGDATPLHRWMDASETPDRPPQPTHQPAYAPPQAQHAPQSFPCPSCGRAVNASQAFCPQCGRPLRAVQPPQIYQPPAPPQPQIYYPVAPQPPKTGRSGGEIALIVIIALIAAMVILVKFC
jgi:hypothetical protein